MTRKNKIFFKRKGRKGSNAVFEKSYSEVAAKKSAESQNKNHKRLKNPTLEDIAVQWLEELKPIRKTSTVVKYAGQLKNYIIPEFGKLKLNEISNENIISFSKKLLTEERKGRKLAPKTVSDILSRMKSIRRFALLRGYEINYVPNAVEIPLKQKKIRVLTAIEENKIIRYLKKYFDLTALGILLSLFTGLRIGELCALKWSDFSLSEQEIYVRRTMQRLRNLDENSEKRTAIEIGESKSTSSIRTIPLPEKLLKYIQTAYVEGAYILSGKQNCFVEPRTMENRFKRILSKCGIKKLHFMHSATHLLQSALS